MAGVQGSGFSRIPGFPCHTVRLRYRNHLLPGTECTDRGRHRLQDRNPAENISGTPGCAAPRPPGPGSSHHGPVTLFLRAVRRMGPCRAQEPLGQLPGEAGPQPGAPRPERAGSGKAVSPDPTGSGHPSPAAARRQGGKEKGRRKNRAGAGSL